MNNNTTYFPLPRTDLIVSIDTRDNDLVRLKWSPQFNRTDLIYVRSYKYGYKSIYLHRMVMERVLGRSLVKGERVDHIDRNTMNNKRSNLRVATSSQNAANAGKHRDGSNPYRGVYRRNNGHYSVKMMVNRKMIRLGTYHTAEEAHQVWLKYAKQHFGEFIYDPD